MVSFVISLVSHFVGDMFVFQQDNVPAHCAHYTGLTSTQ